MTIRYPSGALTARPMALPESPFASLLAFIGAREIRRAYSEPCRPWANFAWVITPNPSIGRKRRARRARGRGRS